MFLKLVYNFMLAIFKITHYTQIFKIIIIIIFKLRPFNFRKEQVGPISAVFEFIF